MSWGEEKMERGGGCGGVSGCLADFSAWIPSCFALNYLLLLEFARMPSILVIVFVLQLAIHLVNTVGAQAINDLVNSTAKQPSIFASSQIH